MLSEDFDKKVRDAADHHHPAYNENAWSGMKKLLDKHMPVEKDRKRRFIFILLFPLLLAGGAWLLFDRLSGGKEREETISKNEQPVNPSSTPSANAPAGSGSEEKNNQPGSVNQPGDKETVTISQDNEVAAPVNRAKPASENNNNDPLSAKKKDPELILAAGGGQKKQKGKRPMSTAPVTETGTNKTNNVTGKENSVTVTNPSVTSPAEASGITSPAETKTVLQEPVNKEKNTAEQAAGNIVVKKATQSEEPVAKKETDAAAINNKPGTVKKTGKKKSSFFFAATASPDISFTGKGQPGTVKILGGAGIGYTYKERFTLRTGFYSGRKVYTALPGEYHMSSWVASYYPNLQKVGADCKVYEIPVLLSYNFGGAKKHSWFGSAGVSTLIMKRETYDYYYKYNPAGPTVNKEFTVRNQNKHPFSILTVSAGYQQHITKHISLIAEPYFKLPLTGVGAGKVKLNSTGVSFTVAVNPFGPGKK